ncbi:MAG: cyclic nucleotide-binding domain-containing protein, partial [Dehalococcoidia bacterium]|nr:cyclic nucleotide-binding domain-containing protein [Dehalococcoidia bacterium]
MGGCWGSGVDGWDGFLGCDFLLFAAVWYLLSLFMVTYPRFLLTIPMLATSILKICRLDDTVKWSYNWSMVKATERPSASQEISPRHLRVFGILELLCGTDIFRSLTPSDLHIFFDHVMAEHCPTGTLLFTPEDSGERVYILKEGLVELYRLTPDGRRLLTRRIQPVAIFGIMGLLGQSIQGNFAETAEDSLICTVNREEVLELLKRRPDVA